jgi:predicted transposase/invertase (TIGR01784 family)
MKILIQEDKDIAKAHEEYQHFIEDDTLREMYEQRQKWQLNYNTDLEIARNEGMEKEKLEAARKMLEKRLDIQLISEIIGLSIEEIEKLKM